MSDLYDKIKSDVKFRKVWADKCSLGFELPPVVPNVQKLPDMEDQDIQEKAA